MFTRTTSRSKNSATGLPPKGSALDFHNRLIAKNGVEDATGFSDHGRRARTQIIRGLLEQFGDPALKIVDYGCNDGQFYDQVAGTAAYTGIDINPAFIKLAKKRYAATLAKFKLGNALTEETNDWLLRHKPNVVIASGVLCYTASAYSYPELVSRLYTCATEALIFNVLVNTRPKDRAVYVWSKHKVLALIEACGCQSWQIIRSYLSNDMTVVMRKQLTHHRVAP